MQVAALIPSHGLPALPSSSSSTPPSPPSYTLCGPPSVDPGPRVSIPSLLLAGDFWLKPGEAKLGSQKNKKNTNKSEEEEGSGAEESP
jgi:hypothetical protein